jgi:hypothetical protein
VVFVDIGDVVLEVTPLAIIGKREGFLYLEVGEGRSVIVLESSSVRGTRMLACILGVIKISTSQ